MGDPARYRTIDGASFKETADWFARAGRSTSRSDNDPHDGRSRLRRREPVYPRGGDLLPLFGWTISGWDAEAPSVTALDVAGSGARRCSPDPPLRRLLGRRTECAEAERQLDPCAEVRGSFRQPNEYRRPHDEPASHLVR